MEFLLFPFVFLGQFSILVPFRAQMDGKAKKSGQVAVGVVVSWRNIWDAFKNQRLIGGIAFLQKIWADCFDSCIIVGNARRLFDVYGILSSTARFLQCAIWGNVCGHFIGCHCHRLEVRQKEWSIRKTGQNEFHFETFVRTHHCALFD